MNCNKQRVSVIRGLAELLSEQGQKELAYKSCVSSMFSFSLWHRDSLLPPGFKFRALQLVRRSFNSKGLRTSPSSVELIAPEDSQVVSTRMRLSVRRTPLYAGACHHKLVCDAFKTQSSWLCRTYTQVKVGISGQGARIPKDRSGRTSGAHGQRLLRRTAAPDKLNMSS